MTRPSGLPFVFAGAVLLSFAPVFVKLVDVGPNAAGFYRMAVGGTVLLGIVLWRRPPMILTRATLGFAALAGALFATDLVLWHQSVHDVGPGLSTILANFQVFLLAAWGILMLGERAGWRLVVAVPMALFGLLLIVGGWGDLPGDTRRGVLLGLGAAVAYGSYLLVFRASQVRATVLDARVTLTIVCFVAAGLLAAWTLGAGESLAIPSARGVGLVVAYGVTAQVLGWLCIAHGLPRAPASRAGLVLLGQPALAFVWDVAFFARPTGLRDLAGVLLALTAIYLGTRRAA